MVVTIVLVASAMMVLTVQFAGTAFSFFISVLTLTLAPDAETCGVVTNVPYHVTCSGLVITR